MALLNKKYLAAVLVSMASVASAQTALPPKAAPVTAGRKPAQAGQIPEVIPVDNTGDNEELKGIEGELEKSAVKPQVEERTKNAPDAGPAKTPEYSDLGHLSPFTEVSVIQKRYMPKTSRFQVFAGLTTITNDPFNNTYGGVLKGSYFFSENWGVELSYFGLTSSQAKTTKELKSIENVNTDNLVSTKSVITGDLMWVPIYGKMSWFNNTIIPFDLYFSLGLGQTKTESEGPQTIHLAAGQIFSLSKSTAIRWDFSFDEFSATSGLTGTKASYNNLFLTVGWSWFFPEATYR